jgi:hypothetical protein
VRIYRFPVIDELAHENLSARARVGSQKDLDEYTHQVRQGMRDRSLFVFDSPDAKTTPDRPPAERAPPTVMPAVFIAARSRSGGRPAGSVPKSSASDGPSLKSQNSGDSGKQEAFRDELMLRDGGRCVCCGLGGGLESVSVQAAHLVDQRDVEQAQSLALLSTFVAVNGIVLYQLCHRGPLTSFDRPHWWCMDADGVIHVAEEVLRNAATIGSHAERLASRHGQPLRRPANERMMIFFCLHVMFSNTNGPISSVQRRSAGRPQGPNRTSALRA